MSGRKSRRINFNKAAGYTIAINALQILGALTVTAFSLATGGHAFMGLWEQMLLSAMTVIVVWGAAMDIREAFNARRMADEADMLEDAYGKLEQLNGTLRAQRHDFMNHLQVVYSLLELEEYESASEYIEKVYGDIQRVSRTLKTAHPAVNALLAAKLSECEERGVQVSVAIESAWQTLPVPGWEMCRVLGNLIDNGMDALDGVPAAQMRIELSEDLHSYSFKISNNGPKIPESMSERIFVSGFSTKNSGRGMGLAIVRAVLEAHGGSIRLTSSDEETLFFGQIKKSQLPAQTRQNAQL